MTAWIVWYTSHSHKKDRFFVGIGAVKDEAGNMIPKPTWTYEKDEATIMDTVEQANNAKKFAESCGYKDIQITPIDESDDKQPAKTEEVPSAPVDAMPIEVV